LAVRWFLGGGFLMASVTINIDPQVYVDGVTLGAYPVSGWLPGQLPAGAPKGSASDTDTLTDGSVTFDLDPGEYLVTKTTSPYNYVSVIVAPVPSEPGALPDYPTDDGSYALVLTVSGGESDLSWFDTGE
jgi:hypothetical protein